MNQFRMCGNTVEIFRYSLTWNETYEEYSEPDEDGNISITVKEGDAKIAEYAVSDEHRDALLELHPDAEVTPLDVSSVEWLDGMEFPGGYAEAQAALERGYAVPKKSLEQIQADVDYIAIMTGVEL